MAAVRNVRRGAVDACLAIALLVLTVLVAVDGWPVRVDLRVFRALLPLRHGWLADVADVVVVLATPEVVAGVTVALAFGLAVRERTFAALRLLPPVLAVVLIVLGGKALLHRVGPPGSRPPGLLGYYPSGHTATSLVCVGAIAQFLALRRPRLATVARGVTATWTALVAGAMVLRGYHWLTDVLAAVLAGALLLRLLARLR